MASAGTVLLNRSSRVQEKNLLVGFDLSNRHEIKDNGWHVVAAPVWYLTKNGAVSTDISAHDTSLNPDNTKQVQVQLDDVSAKVTVDDKSNKYTLEAKIQITNGVITTTIGESMDIWVIDLDAKDQ